jgi:hypothetical protein
LKDADVIFPFEALQMLPSMYWLTHLSPKKVRKEKVTA